MLRALRLTQLGTALVVLGEALALGLGMDLIAGGDNPWVTDSNLILLLTDVGLGGLITYFAVASRETDKFAILAATGLMITHGYRAVEYFLGTANPFCANIWLFLLNDLKLIAAVAIIVLIFRNRRT